jgi:hypothetical protein
MNIVDTVLTNARLGAPSSWDQGKDGRCVTLPTYREDGGLDSYASHTSFWLPTPEDLARLNAGDPIALTIYGNTHPVVAVHMAHTITKEHIVEIIE